MENLREKVDTRLYALHADLLNALDLCNTKLCLLKKYYDLKKDINNDKTLGDYRHERLKALETFMELSRDKFNNREYIHEFIGGKAYKKTLKDISKHHNININKLKFQSLLGIRIELEHTNDKKIAFEIVKDHLFEIPDYYTRLMKMEKMYKLEKRKKQLKESIKKIFRMLTEAKTNAEDMQYGNVKVSNDKDNITISYPQNPTEDEDKILGTLTKNYKIPDVFNRFILDFEQVYKDYTKKIESLGYTFINPKYYESVKTAENNYINLANDLKKHSNSVTTTDVEKSKQRVLKLIDDWQQHLVDVKGNTLTKIEKVNVADIRRYNTQVAKFHDDLNKLNEFYLIDSNNVLKNKVDNYKEELNILKTFNKKLNNPETSTLEAKNYYTQAHNEFLSNQSKRRISPETVARVQSIINNSSAINFIVGKDNEYTGFIKPTIKSKFLKIFDTFKKTETTKTTLPIIEKSYDDINKKIKLIDANVDINQQQKDVFTNIGKIIDNYDKVYKNEPTKDDHTINKGVTYNDPDYSHPHNIKEESLKNLTNTTPETEFKKILDNTKITNNYVDTNNDKLKTRYKLIGEFIKALSQQLNKLITDPKQQDSLTKTLISYLDIIKNIKTFTVNSEKNIKAIKDKIATIQQQIKKSTNKKEIYNQELVVKRLTLTLITIDKLLQTTLEPNLSFSEANINWDLLSNDQLNKDNIIKLKNDIHEVNKELLDALTIFKQNIKPTDDSININDYNKQKNQLVTLWREHHGNLEKFYSYVNKIKQNPVTTKIIDIIKKYDELKSVYDKTSTPVLLKNISTMISDLDESTIDKYEKTDSTIIKRNYNLISMLKTMLDENPIQVDHFKSIPELQSIYTLMDKFQKARFIFKDATFSMDVAPEDWKSIMGTDNKNPKGDAKIKSIYSGDGIRQLPPSDLKRQLSRYPQSTSDLYVYYDFTLTDGENSNTTYHVMPYQNFLDNFIKPGKVELKKVEKPTTKKIK